MYIQGIYTPKGNSNHMTVVTHRHGELHVDPRHPVPKRPEGYGGKERNALAREFHSEVETHPHSFVEPAQPSLKGPKTHSPTKHPYMGQMVPDLQNVLEEITTSKEDLVADARSVVIGALANLLDPKGRRYDRFVKKYGPLIDLETAMLEKTIRKTTHVLTPAELEQYQLELEDVFERYIEVEFPNYAPKPAIEITSTESLSAAKTAIARASQGALVTKLAKDIKMATTIGPQMWRGKNADLVEETIAFLKEETEALK